MWVKERKTGTGWQFWKDPVITREWIKIYPLVASSEIFHLTFALSTVAPRNTVIISNSMRIT
jgi:hypothetical protein